MHLFNVLLLATFAVSSSPKVDYSSPGTVSALRSKLSGLDCRLGTQAVEKLKAVDSDISSRTCVDACSSLKLLLKGEVVDTESQNFTKENSYWSNQQTETIPTCRVQPRSAKEVAVTLLIVHFFGCQFAVKSGGHAAFKGASNIDSGITIDLKNLKQIAVSADRSSTKVGAGNHWADVYSRLEPLGLSVVGGRVANIGVGGLTLGGGISFFSGRYGWACDGVRNYEVVLANGHILNVNQHSHPDLYFALRGGGNNFGIVTRLDLDTFPQGPMWGGLTVHPITANTSIYNAFSNFATASPADPDAALIVATAYVQGTYIFGNDYEYAKPIANPPVFHEFTAIPSLTSTVRITNLTDLTLELNAANPSGFRQTYATATFKNSPDLQAKILEFFIHEVETIKDAPGLLPGLVMQPITASQITHFKKRGGNALGIVEADAPLILLQLAFMWSDEGDDERVLAVTQRIRDGAVEIAEGMGLGFRYVYQNYASLDQDVFAGYGEDNKERLIEISKKYDPEQVFQELQPGYFKLSGRNGGSPV